MPNKKISQLSDAAALTGGEHLEILQGGVNLKTTAQQIADLAGAGITREFSRAFTETIVFDKNVVEYAPHVATGNITFQVGSGNLVDQDAGQVMEITFNGSQSVNFVGFDYLYGITNGEVLEAGTYEFYFLYSNGKTRVNFPGVSSQSSGSIVLSAPSLVAVPANSPNNETQLDISWGNITNNQGYLIEYSLTGTGGWTTLTTTAVDVVTASQTGLSAGNTRYYRGKTLGNGTTTLDSAFSTIVSGQTESSGDVTDPVPTFLPANGNNVWPINKPLRITWDEPVRNTDNSEITNANVASRMRVKQTNVAGADIGFTATVDGTKQIFDAFPVTHWGVNQLVYWDVNNVEDVNNNDITTAISALFTTTAFTYFNGTSNRLQFGDILDALWCANNTNFWLGITINNFSGSGVRPLITKYDTAGNQRMFQFFHTGTNVYFGYVRDGNGVGSRVIEWAGALTGTEHVLVLKYDGAIDTNDGLDRVTLLVDGVPAGSKTMFSNNGEAISTIIIPNKGVQLTVGAFVNLAGTPVGTSLYTGEAKDFKVWSAAGSVLEIDVPNLVTGLDISGNARNGTWV